MKADSDPTTPPVEVPEETRCPQCGYSLRGLTGERCPECALSLDAIRALGHQLPWVHRRHIGLVRAYWRTVWAATFRGKRFFGDMPEHVDYADAKRFRRMTVGMVVVTMLVVFGWYGLANPAIRTTVVANHWLVAVNLASELLALFALTGVPSYLFHPRRLSIGDQNRAVAISYYTCAPLAWTSLAIVPVGIFAVNHLLTSVTLDDPPWSLIGLGAIAVVVWWVNLLFVSRLVVGRSRMGLAGVALVVPMLWLVVSALLIVALPVLIFYVVALFYALS